MTKRILCFLLCLILPLSLAVPAFAEEPEAPDLTIRTAEEFLTFAENCRLDSFSLGLTVSLEGDIDLSGREFESIPIFSGTFLGNGHTITGLTLTADGSYQGLFRYLTEEAVLQDLHLEATLQPEGSRNSIGGIAGENAGSIRNCTVTAEISGSSYIGGIAGINTVTGIIEGAAVEGQLYGSHFVGGIAGENQGVIRSCENRAQINITAQQNTVSLGDITLDTLTNSEAANTVTDIGGIAGTSSGVIRDCRNEGDVGYPLMGYNIGGIAGTQTGYITDCENNGEIRGRKEVGGIAGQMEPSSLIEYSEDTLQILKTQLGTMSGLVSRASGNVQTNATHIHSQIGLLQDQAETALDAVNSLFPDSGDPELPDEDTLLAAKNTLSDSLSAMPGTMDSIAAAAQTTVSGLTRDLQALSVQISAMEQTLQNAAETLGGTITDISDADTPETLTGKVEACENRGNILGDANVGGIAGAMAMENDLDILEDWQTSGDSSLNFVSQVRSVILNCENHGSVTGKKQNAGGIVGWQSMGLVKDSINVGSLEGSEYAGGIAGFSSGYIRNCSAKSLLSGSSCIGGIAGSGTIVTDCRSIVVIQNGKEQLGAVLGTLGQNLTEEEIPVSGNFYLNTGANVGAIDGIDYDTQAQSLNLEDYLALEDLPKELRTVNVRFQYESGVARQISLAPGQALDLSQVPTLPAKEGYSGIWEGLEDADLENILFDLTFEGRYLVHSAAIGSSENREGKPLLLIQGDFSERSQVTLDASDLAPELAEGETLLESRCFSVSDCAKLTALRILIPEGAEGDHLKVYVQSSDGSWRDGESILDGSYLVLSAGLEDAGYAIAEISAQPPLWLPALALAAALFLLFVFLKRKKAPAKKQPQPEQQDN